MRSDTKSILLCWIGMIVTFIVFQVVGCQTATAQPRCGSFHCAPVVIHNVATVTEVVRIREVLVPTYTSPAFISDQRFNYLYNPHAALLYFGGYTYNNLPTYQQPQYHPQQCTQPMPVQRQQMPAIVPKNYGNTFAAPPHVPGYEPVSLVEQEPIQETKYTYLDVLVENCALCHTEGRLKGNDYVLFSNGNLVKDWSAQQVWDAIAGGRMPPVNRPRVSAKGVETLKRDFKIGR